MAVQATHPLGALVTTDLWASPFALASNDSAFAQRGYDLKRLLREAGTDADIVDAVSAIWRRRDDRYSELRTAETARSRKVEMSYIGG